MMRIRPMTFVCVFLVACTTSSSVPIGAPDGSLTDSGVADVVDEGDASVLMEPSVDKSSLGEACSATSTCPTGSTCSDFHAVAGEDPDLQSPRCAPNPPCSHVTCPSGQKCIIAESNPIQVFCDR